MDQQTTRRYWQTWSATLVFFAGFYALLVPLPLQLQRFGFADWQLGLVLGVFGLASLMGRPFVGILVDRWGPKPVMLLGALSLLLGALGVPNTADFGLQLGLRLLQTVGYVAFTTAGTAQIVALSPLAERGRRLAIFGAAANVAISMTPALITALLTVMPLPVAFWVSGGLAVLAASLVMFGPAAPSLSSNRASAPIRWRIYRVTVLAALFGAGFAAFFQFIPILAERRATISAGVLYSIYGLTIIATRFGAGRMLDRLPTVRLLRAAAVMLIVGLLNLAFSSNPWLIGFATMLIASSGGVFHPILIAEHARLMPETPGQATATFYIGFDLGIGVGSWVFGVMLQWFGLAGLYLSAVVGIIIALLLIQALPNQAAEAQ